LKHPFRVTARFLWLAGEFLLAAGRYALPCVFCRTDGRANARAAWLRRSSPRVLRIFKLEPEVSGPIPGSGLLVCNHLSYLDILVLATLTPCVFVAKEDVKHWPVLGWFARMAGTIFVNRDRRSQVGQTAGEIRSALERGLLVVLFPEGTSSGGETVLPFKSSLLQPAERQSHPLAVACLQYHLEDGDASEEVCYWKDMTLVPHLLNLLSKRAVRASVSFRQIRDGHADRKRLARQLHAEVWRLKLALAVSHPK
jgi:1-acyl-sn-glycerol-3-phosphate acyltransferase